jgi:hypothetical protein
MSVNKYGHCYFHFVVVAVVATIQGLNDMETEMRLSRMLLKGKRILYAVRLKIIYHIYEPGISHSKS